MERGSRRFDGVITSWNDERGFGFITPSQRGDEVFVHIRAVLNRQGERPREGQRVTFEVEPGAQGRKRAKGVLLDTPSNRRARRPARDTRAAYGTASLFAIPAFAALYLAVAVVWHVPHSFAATYAAASVICAVAYALDKSAAQQRRWRISERTLLMLGLLGGWPGGLLAQQRLRHKSVKPSFRSAFWLTVLVNVAAFVALAHPALRALLPL